MELRQLRCFVAVAEELHFGRAARRLEMLPAALGRQIRMLESDLATRLLTRSTRTVALTEDGAGLLEDARDVLGRADALAANFRQRGRRAATTLRLGAIDTAAAGLVPLLLHDLRRARADLKVQLFEDKTVRLLPRLLSGSLDLAFVRPPEQHDKRIEFRMVLHETAVVAVPAGHRFAKRKLLSVDALADEPLIVPERRSRPHSYDLTFKLFEGAGSRPKIAQVAQEKQTIVSLVAAEIGLAIVPRWASRLSVAGVRYVPLKAQTHDQPGLLPLAAAWVRGTRDPARDALLALLEARLSRYSAQA